MFGDQHHVESPPNIGGDRVSAVCVSSEVAKHRRGQGFVELGLADVRETSAGTRFHLILLSFLIETWAGTWFPRFLNFL